MDFRPLILLGCVTLLPLIVPGPAECQGRAATKPAGLSYTREKQKLPFRARWGTLTVTVEQMKDDLGSQRCRILGSSGQMLREVKDQYIDEVSLVDMNRSGSPELLVVSNEGGAHGIQTYYYYTTDGSLRNLAVLGRDGTTVKGHKDLDNDGLPEVIGVMPHEKLWDWSLGYLRQYRTFIFKWQDNRFADVTRNFTDRSRAAMGSNQRAFLAAKRKGETDAMQAHASGYYVEAVTIGDGPAALQWLGKNAPREVVRWVTDNRSTLEREVSAAASRVKADQSRTLKSSIFDPVTF